MPDAVPCYKSDRQRIATFNAFVTRMHGLQRVQPRSPRRNNIRAYARGLRTPRYRSSENPGST
jgi:hypothetical protein